MALRIQESRTFSETCESADGESFVAEFCIWPDEELDRFDFLSGKGEKAFLEATIVKLSGVVGNDGKELEYTDALKADVLSFADLRMALMKGYSSGLIGAKAGN